MLVTVGMALFTLKRMREVGPSKCFIRTIFFSLFPDHFQKNDEDDQYHNVHYNHYINVII